MFVLYYIGDIIKVIYPESFAPHSDLNGHWKAWIRKAAKSPKVTLRTPPGEGAGTGGWIAADVDQRGTGWVPEDWIKLVLPKRQGLLFL